MTKRKKYHALVSNLSHFGIHHTTGFLSPNPLKKLPKKFGALDELAHALPHLIENGTDYLRKTLNDFPLLDVSTLKGSALRRAMMIYHFLQNAYVHSPPAVTRIPANLAIPSRILAGKFGKPPNLSYNSYVLDNWQLDDPDGPFEIQNLDTLIDFSIIPDDPGFKLVHVGVEYRAAPGIAAIGPLQEYAFNDEPDLAESGLWRMSGALEAMYAELLTMPFWCSPDVYYLSVRPWIQMFPGVVYEGVAAYQGEPQILRGETGAQSSILPSFDAALGVQHEHTPLTDYLYDMQNYMPPGHRAFIQVVQRGPDIRAYVAAVRLAALVDAYNSCIEGLVRFREKHFQFALDYIVAKKEGALGTGGTPFEQWLKKLLNETRQCIIA